MNETVFLRDASVQDIQLELLRRTSFNALDGEWPRRNSVRRGGVADRELAEFRQREGTRQSSFLFHYARLIEILCGVEHIEQLLEDPDVLSGHHRARAGVNRQEGVGCSEAPRGTLFHHYQVDEHAEPSHLLMSGLIKLRDLRDNIWNADTLFILTPTHELARQLARIAEEEDWGGEVLVFKEQQEIDRALGTGRREYGLLSVWWD